MSIHNIEKARQSAASKRLADKILEREGWDLMILASATMPLLDKQDRESVQEQINRIFGDDAA